MEECGCQRVRGDSGRPQLTRQLWSVGCGLSWLPDRAFRIYCTYIYPAHAMPLQGYLSLLHCSSRLMEAGPFPKPTVCVRGLVLSGER